MKLSKPEDMNQEDSAGSSGSAGESAGAPKMPVIETALTDRLTLDPMPVDEAAEVNGDVLDDVFGRLGVLDSRVEELEAENETLREKCDELEEVLDQTLMVLDEMDSVERFTIADDDP